MWKKLLEFARAAARWVRYGYFLRFSLILWFFAPIICGLNMNDATLTSGILVAEFWEQYFCIGFFLASAGLAALCLARIVLINGPERWDAESPPRLKRLFVNDDGEFEFHALLLSQGPNLFVFAYLLHFGVCQGVHGGTIFWGIVGGGIVAFFVWWLANAWYYLTFKASAIKDDLIVYTLGANAARTILFPRACFRLNRARAQCPGRPTIEQAITKLSGRGFSRIEQWIGLRRFRLLAVKQKGYGSPRKRGPHLYEAQSFAVIALIVLAGLYFLIWPLTAPVHAVFFSWVAIGILCACMAVVLYVFWTARPAVMGNLTGSLLWIRIIISAACAVFLLSVILLYSETNVERFPIFATVLILVIALCWFLGGAAFLLDRYRVPVLTLLLLAVVVPRMLHLDRAFWTSLGAGQEEHYLSITTSTQSAELPTPMQILEARRSADGSPLIIVTATGGGLHASAWTAAVLARLERQFGYRFHEHLLLASTVSGGSIGLLTYLRELHEGMLDSKPELGLARMQSAAQCSSLEGVGWGLIYYDLPKAFVPLLPYLVSPSSGDDDLAVTATMGTPIGKDRTWALRKSFDRNLRDRYCKAIWENDNNPSADWDPRTDAKNAQPNGLTMRDFVLTASQPANSYPAITMNTTVVESGERFLLANYKIPDLELEENGPNYRARSFLATFRHPAGERQADLPLATAAQMSATFPYVSSAARAPLSVDKAVNSVHFADGGYYDNDGTASAIEFLRYALGEPPTQSSSATVPKPAPNASQQAPPPATSAPVRILLVEIRNSGDIEGSGSEYEPDHNGGTTPWNLFDQVGAPLLGFWQAGHESVTARDQSALELLEHANDGKLEVRAVTFADNWSSESVGTDPLNWSLTPRQRKEVQASADRSELKERYECAKSWFDASQNAWSDINGSEAHALTAKCPNQ